MSDETVPCKSLRGEERTNSELCLVAPMPMRTVSQTYRLFFLNTFSTAGSREELGRRFSVVRSGSSFLREFPWYFMQGLGLNLLRGGTMLPKGPNTCRKPAGIPISTRIVFFVLGRVLRRCANFEPRPCTNYQLLGRALAERMVIPLTTECLICRQKLLLQVPELSTAAEMM